MGIEIEFNPDLCLRNIKEFQEAKKEKEECLPETLEVGITYPFLKSNQRNFYMGDVFMPLREILGGGKLSKPIAAIEIVEATHFKKNGKVFTKGFYKVVKLLDQEKIYFDGFEPIGTTFKY